MYNLIRGTDPQPGAWTTFEDRPLQLFDAARASAFGRPGQVADVSDAGITVVAGGGGIRVGRVRYDGGSKVGAAEFAAEHGLAAGARLGMPTATS